MKVVVVLGSPRKNSVSTQIANRIATGAKDAGHEIVTYSINDLNVRGCQGCRYCKENSADCILNDDLKPYWKDLHECGALILAAPNYCSQVNGPMITYMNRHYCILDKNGQTRVTPGKIKLIGIFAQGGPVPNETAERNYDWYLADFENRKIVLTEKIVVGRGDDVSPDSRVMCDAFLLGKSL